MKQPFINIEENIDRLVGRRTKTPDALSTTASNVADSIAWRKAFGGVRVPRGVYRFKTHEEADEWLWRDDHPSKELKPGERPTPRYFDGLAPLTFSRME